MAAATSGAHDPARQAGGRALGIDDGCDAQAGVDAPAQCASSQFCAARASTCSGTVSCTAGSGAFSITWRTTSMVASTSASMRLEDQFVVHLQQHAGTKLRMGQRIVHADHGTADDVGGRTLDGRIDGGAFEEGALGGIGRIDAREVAAPPEDGLDIALLARRLLRRFHVIADAGEAREIGLDVVARLLAADTQLVGQAEGRDAVDDAEVDCLGAPPHHRVHALDRHAEHFARRHGMNVDAVGEGLLQLRDIGHMGQHAQFDLAVVGADQLRSGRRHEGGADLAALLGAHRDVLQIGFGRGETARGGCRHRVAGVDAAGLRVDVARQRVGIGRAQLGQLPPVEHAPRQFHALAGEILQRVGVGRPGAGGRLASAGQAHAAIEHVAQLLGRADVEALARQIVDLRLDRRRRRGELVREPLQHVGVDDDAGPSPCAPAPAPAAAPASRRRCACPWPPAAA